MSASVITRATITDDDGSGTVGTIFNSAWVGTALYDKIDQLFGGSGSYATLTHGGKIAAEGFGTHSFSAGGTGNNTIAIRNTTAGTGNFASVQIGNDSDAILTILQSYSSTFTTSGYAVASGSILYANGVGGLSIVAANATGAIRLYSGGSTERARLFASGGLSLGNTSDPGAAVLSVGASSDVTLGASGLNFNAGASYTNTQAGIGGSFMNNAGFSMTTWPTTASAANAFVADGAQVKRNTSIRAAKHDIQPITREDANATIDGLSGVTFRSLVDVDQRRWAGFVADDAEQVNPALVTYNASGALEGFTYDRVPAYLVPYVQELKRRVEALEQR